MAGSDKLVFVDLSDKVAKSTIFRGGFQVPTVEFDTSKLDFHLGDLIVEPPRGSPRVFLQSLSPGTKVPRGTAVDLVFARSIDLPFDVIKDVHVALKDRPLDAAAALLDDPTVREPLLKYDRPDDVPLAERNGLIAKFNAAQIPIDEADPGRTFAKAFGSLKGAAAFR